MTQRFRIGNNLSLIWLLYEDDGNIHNLEGKELELYMTCGGLKFVVTDYTITENAVAWTFPARLQTRTGYYKLVLLERDPQRGLYSFDVAEAFCLEPEDALTNIETIIDEDATVQVRSVLTYAHITNLASVDTVETEEGYDAVIRLTNGKAFTLPLGGGAGRATNIIDNLTSHSTTDALSANQGRVLKSLIDAIDGMNVVDNLTSVSRTDALSANMGRELKRLIDSIDVTPGSGSVTIVNDLVTGGADKALSAEMGKALKALIDSIPGSGSGSAVDTMYSDVSSNPGTPDTNPGNWHPNQRQGDVWIAIRFSDGASWGEWTVLFIGDIELPYASFKSFAFTRSNAASVAAPTGGSYTSPVPTTSGWEDGIPSGDGAVWMSSRTFASDNVHSDAAWSTPEIVADNEIMDYEFSSIANPGEPNKATPGSNNTNPNWSNTASAGTIWMAMREVRNNEYKAGSSWMIVKIKGENGADGTSVKILGTLSSSGDLPDPYSGDAGDGYLIDGNLWVWDGDSWENVGEIKGERGDDGQTPFLHIKYSNDGGVTFTGSDGEEPGDYIGMYWDYNASDSSTPSNYAPWKYWKGNDGFGYEYIFKLTSSEVAPTLPSTSENVDDYVPTGWTDDPGLDTATLETYRWCWVAWRKKEDGVWSAWHGTTGGKARLYAYYSEDGAVGDPGQAQFKSVVFKRSDSQPTRPGNETNKLRYYRMVGNNRVNLTPEQAIGATGVLSENNPNYGGTFDDPIPYGWNDGVPALSNVSDPDSLENTLWMTSRRFTDDGLSPQDENWAYPSQAFDTSTLDIEYAYEQVNDARPADPTTANRHGGSGTQIWFDPVEDKYTSGTVLRDFTEMCWMAMRAKINGTGTGPWTVLRIKGEKGRDGIDGSDGVGSKPVRIRNWSDVAAQSLSGDQKVFSGYEDGAPFRDVLIVTKSDYPDGTVYPFVSQNENVPALVTINYSASYEDGYPGSYFTASTIPQGGNYSTVLPASKAESATSFIGGAIWNVFANFGAVYIQLLVATQAYIGSLTVDHLTTSIGTNSSIYIQGGLITVKDANGVTRMQIGQGSGDSTPVLKFFDASGTLLYDLGPNGIRWAGDGSTYIRCSFGDRIVLGRLCGIGATVSGVYSGGSAASMLNGYHVFTPVGKIPSGGTAVTHYYNFNTLQESSTPWVSAENCWFSKILVKTDKAARTRPAGANSEMEAWPLIEESLLAQKPADGWYMDNTGGFASNFHGQVGPDSGSGGDEEEE